LSPFFSFYYFSLLYILFLAFHVLK
jgi:hypothetical protein